MAVNLSPVGGVAGQFFDNNGNPLAGGKIFTYSAGTTTNQATYTSATGAIAHSNPIILDGAGRVPSGEIWLTDGLEYKFVIKDNVDALIGTFDNIIGINSNFVNFTNQQELQTATAGQTVFTLTTMQYQPATNSLSVFVDGVNQYGPGALYAYVETDSTTVTFTTGLHVGAEVKFTTSNLNSSAGGDAFQVSYTPPFVGSVTTNVGDKLAQTVSVKDFGAVGDGVVDDSSAIQDALDTGAKVVFPIGTYLMNSSVTVQTDDIEVDFGNATIVNGGGTFLFNFGATADTPQNSGLRISGGYFTQSNPATTSNQNYIRVAGFSDFIIAGCNMKNVSNGGIYIEAGCENGLIDGCTIIGATAYSTIRGIWLIGATASDYSSNYMDNSSLTRNATPFPVYAVKNVRVTNCRVETGSYGIYNMNTRDCVFENNYIADFGGERAITINTYSPRAIIKNNTIVGSGTTSGILVTQASNGVIIDGNTFQGGFGGGRAIQVQYLAETLITNNYFFSTGSQAIDLNTAGTATVRGNYFKRAFGTNSRAVYALPVDRNIAGTGVIGDTATKVPGFVFENNTVSGWGASVLLGTNTSASGNEPGWESVIVRGNLMYEMNLATTSSEYLLRPVNTSATQSFTVQYYDNWVFPETAAIRNRPLVTGDVVFERSDYYSAAFTVSVAVSGGAITVTKSYGANFDLTITRTGTNLLLTPRSPKGSTGGQAVPNVIGVTPDSNNFVQFKLLKGSGTWTLTLVDAAGANLDMTSAAATFVVHLSTNVS
jgi:hypothetical protein